MSNLDVTTETWLRARIFVRTIAAHWLGYVVAAVTCVAVLAGGCRPKVGSKCSADESDCADSHTALRCNNQGVMEGFACKGPLGCTRKDKGGIACDDSIADEGVPCMLAYAENWACTPDRQRALLCEENARFGLHLRCRGPNGCSVKQDWKNNIMWVADSLSCDLRIQDKGDPCPREGLGLIPEDACAIDRAHLLRCKDGKFDVFARCRGPSGCSLKGEETSCDQTVAEEGDVCTTEGTRACSADGTRELVCQKDAFALARDCKPRRCRTDGAAPHCE